MKYTDSKYQIFMKQHNGVYFNIIQSFDNKSHLIECERNH